MAGVLLGKRGVRMTEKRRATSICYMLIVLFYDHEMFEIGDRIDSPITDGFGNTHIFNGWGEVTMYQWEYPANIHSYICSVPYEAEVMA